jgi:hypothetical protein
MKNITLSADEQTIKRARAAARMRGMSLNQVIREYLEELASGSQTDNEFQRLEELSALAAGRRGGWKFDRDEIHERT